MRSLPSSYATGNQRPTSSVIPAFASNDVFDALDLLSSAGFECMDWQAYLLEAWMGVAANGRWSAPIVGNETPRQQGKTRCIQGRAAAEMLFYEGTVIYTAQLQKTSTETFEEMAQLVDTRALRKFLAPGGIRTALGREEIRMKNGARMKFLARTRNGGNGQHGSLLIFDEAQYLEPQAQGSFLAAISACRTRRGPQTIYNGNAPEDDDYAQVYEKIRADALSGNTSMTAWTEWGCGCTGDLPDVADRNLWWRVNPSWGVLLHPDTVEAEFESEDAVRFAHQRLGWFRKREAEKGALFKRDEWAALQVASAPDGPGKRAFGVRFTADGAGVALSACKLSGDAAHVEFIREAPMSDGIGWLESFLSDPARLATCAAIAIDGKSDAADLEKRLRDAGVPKPVLMVATPATAISAAGMLTNAIRDGKLTHVDDPALATSVLTATRRPIGREGYGFGGNFAARVESCALALWAARTTKRDPSRKGRVGC